MEPNHQNVSHSKTCVYHFDCLSFFQNATDFYVSAPQFKNSEFIPTGRVCTISNVHFI